MADQIEEMMLIKKYRNRKKGKEREKERKRGKERRKIKKEKEEIEATKGKRI